jgi:hypothetical protein
MPPADLAALTALALAIDEALQLARGLQAQYATVQPYADALHLCQAALVHAAKCVDMLAEEPW